jgi:hypothetical protein
VRKLDFNQDHIDANIIHDTEEQKQIERTEIISTLHFNEEESPDRFADLYLK